MPVEMHVLLLVVAAALGVAQGAYLPPKCPDACTCQPTHAGTLQLRCNSLHFLAKIQPKQILAIDTLDLSGLNLRHVDPKLSKLRNLKDLNLSNNALSQLTTFPHLPKLTTLDLSSNHLKQFAATSLPDTLEHLDISKNYISELPNDLVKLSYLRQLILDGNPVRCDCVSVNTRDKLLQSGVVLSKAVTCQVPDKLSGRSFFGVTCADENPIDYSDQMQGDDPFADEGSGDDNVIDTSDTSDVHSLGEQLLPPSNDHSQADQENEVEADLPTRDPFVDDEPNDDVAPTDTSDMLSLGEDLLPSSEDHSNHGPLVEVEGSGDDAIAGTPEPSVVPATEEPEEYDEYEGSGSGFADEFAVPDPTNATPPPHDSACIFDCSTDGKTTTTIDPFNATEPSILDGIKIILTDLSGRNETEKKETAVTEETIVPHTVHKEESQPDGNNEETDTDRKQVEVFDNNKKETDELSRQAAAPDGEELKEEPDQAATYIVVAGLVIIMICLVIYSVMKRRKQRAHRPPQNGDYKAPPDQELTDIGQKKNGQPQALDIPEKVPLINGKNGNTNGLNGVQEKVAYPALDASPVPSSVDDVQLRSNGRDSDPLVPETYRVTIQQKELSTPKTPLLVNRHRSDDGSIVSTPTTTENIV